MIPKACPEVSEATVLELADMGIKGVYPNTQEYVLDQMYPYCAYIRGLRGDLE